MKLNAVRAGLARVRESPRGEWYSAIEKHRVDAPVRVTADGIAGDQQADRINHGGADKAVLAYCADHYRFWREELKGADLQTGAMGENLEITEQAEPDVCIGDTFRMDEVLFQVSQPRQPCWKPAWLNDISDLTRRIVDTGRTGWYLRVMREGMLAAPCPIELVERPHPEWTVERANRMVYHRTEPYEARFELAALDELSEAWRKWLRGEE